jgi:hypothetical protein
VSKEIHEEHPELMHYIAASGLHGIVTSRTPWAGHVSFLNDTEEVHGFYNRVLPEILRPEFERYIEEDDRLADYIRTASSTGVEQFDPRLRKVVDLFHEAETRSQNHYVVSFFATDDEWISRNRLLSQRRGYGLDGGYVIIF